MRYDARFCVAVRGPLEQVRKLPELPQEWFASLNESDQTGEVKSDVKMLERFFGTKTGTSISWAA